MIFCNYKLAMLLCMWAIKFGKFEVFEVTGWVHLVVGVIYEVTSVTTAGTPVSPFNSQSLSALSRFIRWGEKSVAHQSIIQFNHFYQEDLLNLQIAAFF